MTTTMKERIKRSGDIRMKVAEDIEQRLDRISKVYGLSLIHISEPTRPY